MTTRTDFTKSKTKDNLLTDTEVEKMIKGCESPLETFVVMMLFYTGLRVSEFTHMRSDWIDREMGLIRIPKQQRCTQGCCRRELRNKKGQVTKPSGTWMPKTSEGSRAVPIVPEVKGVLEKYFSKHKTVMEEIPSRGSAHYLIRKVARRVGIKHPVFPHVGRGTFATQLARKDFNAFEITSTMGWRSIKTAEDYIKLSGGAVKQAFEKKW